MPAPSTSYSVLLTDVAVRYLKKLDNSVAEQIKKKMRRLSDAAPARSLKRHPDIFILEIGQYRALYLIDDTKKAKTVFFIGDHKEYEKRYATYF